MDRDQTSRLLLHHFKLWLDVQYIVQTFGYSQEWQIGHMPQYVTKPKLKDRDTSTNRKCGFAVPN